MRVVVQVEQLFAAVESVEHVLEPIAYQCVPVIGLAVADIMLQVEILAPGFCTAAAQQL